MNDVLPLFIWEDHCLQSMFIWNANKAVDRDVGRDRGNLHIVLIIQHPWIRTSSYGNTYY